MTCDRCKDIHQAQKEGKTQNKCLCDCHYNNFYYTTTIAPTTTNPNTIWHNTSAGTGTTATFTFSPANCVCVGSSKQCDKCSGKKI